MYGFRESYGHVEFEPKINPRMVKDLWYIQLRSEACLIVSVLNPCKSICEVRAGQIWALAGLI